MDWRDIDIAKINLARIKKHYEFYQKTIEWTHPKPVYEDIIKDIDEKWFLADENQYIQTHYLNLVTDNGTEFREQCFWIGHFEKLIEISINIDITNSVYTF